MVEIDVSLVSEAVVVWTGWHQEAWPHRDESRVVDHYGSELAVELMPVVTQMEDDFYSSDAHHRARNLVEMGDIAASEFRAKHPDVSDEAVKALTWCYTWDYK